MLVLEESGRAALWRRLDSLCRGRAIDRDALADLFYAANQGVKLDDAGWQNELVDAGKALRPRLFIFDPLARLKAPGRDESAQKEYGPVIEFLRHLRTETGATVAFVQHTGHQGDRMRGTSDLESVWESRLAFKRDANTITIDSDHREAQSSPPLSYRITWDEQTRTIRLVEIADDLPAKVAKHLRDNPDDSANDVFKALGGNRPAVLAAVKSHRQQVVPTAEYQSGTTPSGTPSASGIPDPLSPRRESRVPPRAVLVPTTWNHPSTRTKSNGSMDSVRSSACDPGPHHPARARAPRQRLSRLLERRRRIQAPRLAGRASRLRAARRRGARAGRKGAGRQPDQLTIDEELVPFGEWVRGLPTGDDTTDRGDTGSREDAQISDEHPAPFREKDSAPRSLSRLIGGVSAGDSRFRDERGAPLCRDCGAPLPAYRGRGRPRLLCIGCAHPRPREPVEPTPVVCSECGAEFLGRAGSSGVRPPGVQGRSLPSPPPGRVPGEAAEEGRA